MINIDEIRNKDQKILAIGNYRPGYQGIFDFDYMSGKDNPSIAGIVTNGARFQKYFWGNGEILVPCFKSIEEAAQALPDIDWMLNISSARRARSATDEFFSAYPNSKGAHIFAEDITEIDALQLYDNYQKNGKTIIGPAGVGLVVGGAMKLGVIGGVDHHQLASSGLTQPGTIAVLSASGGMTNELINIVSKSGHAVSFALCFGGDRFPSTTPKEAFLSAEADPNTEAIIYYGELGGVDEYDVAELIKSGDVKKPVTAYIAGVIGESFDRPVQFGHAKALARSKDETATAKRKVLEEAGATVANSIKDLHEKVSSTPKSDSQRVLSRQIGHRSSSLFTSTISKEKSGEYFFAGSSLTDWAESNDIALLLTTAIMGKRPSSTVTSDFVREVFLLSFDHGPQVSGALNTIVTARAGKGLVDSLAAGLMTIGPRFGGAVSDAAREWFNGVKDNISPSSHVENYAKSKKLIGGIGHKKYRVGFDDPRNIRLARFIDFLDKHPHYDYAKGIEAITTTKKGTLILNVDGHIAAIMLDILAEKEAYDEQSLSDLIDSDFFNALFVIPRLVGFTAHYLDQKRIDEGLFRLPDEDILLA